MDLKKVAFLAVVLLFVLAAVSLVFRLLAGLASGAFNLVLGLLVVGALVVIVLWMFAYAKSKRK